jgi:hypothetical protein
MQPPVLLTVSRDTRALGIGRGGVYTPLLQGGGTVYFRPSTDVVVFPQINVFEDGKLFRNTSPALKVRLEKIQNLKIWYMNLPIEEPSDNIPPWVRCLKARKGKGVFPAYFPELKRLYLGTEEESLREREDRDICAADIQQFLTRRGLSPQIIVEVHHLTEVERCCTPCFSYAELPGIPEDDYLYVSVDATEWLQLWNRMKLEMHWNRDKLVQPWMH